MNDKVLEDLEGLYEETRNPLYAWAAIEECRKGNIPRRPLPDWCRNYLETVACELMTLAESDGEPSKKAGHVAAALALTRRGKNAFKDYAANHDNALLAFWYEHYTKTRRGEKFLDDQATKKDLAPETARKRIAKARRLWQAQENKRND